MQKHSTKLLNLWQEALQEGDDPVRKLLQTLLQRIMEEELTQHLNAQPYERSPERCGWRNGHYPRTLKTRVGTLQLLVPRDRNGQFRTEVFERYSRSEKALLATLQQMVIKGVSTRKVRRVVEELCGDAVSKSFVSSVFKALDEEVEAWRSRPLKEYYPYLICDAMYEKVRRGGRVEGEAVMVVVGVDEEGYRGVLGVWCGVAENGVTWGEVFEDLRRRGLREVGFVVSDASEGLKDALRRSYPGAVWQRCSVHFMRNVLGRVRAGDAKEVRRLLKDVFGAPDREEAERRLVKVAEWLRGRGYEKVAEDVEEVADEVLAYYGLPEAHRRRLRTTNMLERVFCELRRRTRVVRVFPDERFNKACGLCV